MATQKIVRIGRIYDKDLIKFVKSVDSEIGLNSSHFYIGNKTVSLADDAIKVLNKVKNPSYNINRVSLNTSEQSIQLEFFRGVSLSNDSPTMARNRQSSSFYDEVIITYHPNNAFPAPEMDEIIKLDQLISPLTNSAALDTLKNESSGVIEVLTSEVSELSKLHHQMLSSVDNHRQELDKKFDQKVSKLNKKFEEQEKETELFHKLTEQKLENEKADLEKKRKALDDRDHMHVQRGLREKINSDISTRIKETLVPQSAFLSRLLIAGLVFAAIVSFGWVSLVAFGELQTLIDIIDTSDEVAQVTLSTLLIVALKSFLNSMAAFGFTIFLLKFLTKNYNEDLKTYRDLENYSLDINRSSWAIETIMHMRKTQSNEPPPVWVEAVCNNLFNYSEIRPDESIDMKDLLLASAKLEVGSDGSKLEFNKKGTKKLANKLEN